VTKIEKIQQKNKKARSFKNERDKKGVDIEDKRLKMKGLCHSLG
jgi:hypothetical protein